MTFDDGAMQGKTTVAVIGGGAVGGMLAAAARRAGHAVTVCVRTPFPRLEIEEAEGGGVREVPVRIAGDPKTLKTADWVLLATKAQDTSGAKTWLDALVGPDTTVVVLQNGLGLLERVRPLVGDAPVLPAIVYLAAEQVRPGRIVHHSGGRLIVAQGCPGAAFVRLLANSGMEVSQTPDFATAAWLKLLSNVAANPITTLTARRVGVMLEPKIHALARGLLLEAAATARAEGAGVSDQDAENVLAVYGTYGFTAGSSMLYDRLAGKSLEHAYLTGAVVDAADRHGVPVPLNRAVLALLEALDKGR